MFKLKNYRNPSTSAGRANLAGRTNLTWRPKPVGKTNLNASSFSWLRRLCMLGTLGLSSWILSGCSLLDIGHDKFYCQEDGVTCVNASGYLQQSSSHQVLTVPQYQELSHSLLQPLPNTQQLLNPYQQGYLQIWVARYRLQHKIYNSTILLVPYLH